MFGLTQREHDQRYAFGQEWIDYGLSLYMNAITARLSMDDVVPQGSSSSFDTSDLTALTVPPTGHPRED